jgi:hypothetical protein
MSLFPALGVAIALFIPLAVIVGEGWLMAQISVFFFVLLVLLSLIAVEIDGEDRWLTVFAPLSVIGYKQFLDVILFKSVYDVLTDRDIGWTSAGRPDQLPTQTLPSPTARYQSTQSPVSNCHRWDNATSPETSMVSAASSWIQETIDIASSEIGIESSAVWRGGGTSTSRVSSSSKAVAERAWGLWVETAPEEPTPTDGTGEGP